MDYVQNVPHKDDVPMLSYEQIEVITNRILNDMRPESLTQCTPVPVESIMEKSFGLHIEAQTMSPNGSVLGQTYFLDREDQFCTEDGLNNGWKRMVVPRETVVIDTFMYEHEPQQLAFTEAHELGHWVLHQLFYTNDTEVAARTRSIRNNRTPFRPRTAIEWTEWQADRFAGCFLLPRGPVRQVTKAFLNDHKLHYTKLLDFADPMMRSLFIDLSETLAKKMGVSRDCARIRLETLFKVRYPTRRYHI